jgi:hypothetical protein
MKKKEEKYQITPKGVVCSIPGGYQALDQLELVARRHYSKDGYPAIIWTDKGAIFTTVEKVKK